MRGAGRTWRVGASAWARALRSERERFQSAAVVTERGRPPPRRRHCRYRREKRLHPPFFAPSRPGLPAREAMFLRSGETLRLTRTCRLQSASCAIRQNHCGRAISSPEPCTGHIRDENVRAGWSNPNPIHVGKAVAAHTSRQVRDYALCADCEDLFIKKAKTWGSCSKFGRVPASHCSIG